MFNVLNAFIIKIMGVKQTLHVTHIISYVNIHILDHYPFSGFDWFSGQWWNAASLHYVYLPTQLCHTYFR